MSNDIYDYAVIGAGYGGLTAAALLTKKGYKVLLLESHTTAGGCAGYYKRKDFTFDVGATTLTGFGEGEPLDYLCKELNLKANTKRLDPGMVIVQKEQELVRYSMREKWIDEISTKLKQDHRKQSAFWKNIYKINHQAWKLLAHNDRLLPGNIFEYMRLANLKNMRGLGLAPGLFFSMKSYMKKFDLLNQDFISFVDEQLLITTQNDYKLSPYLPAALGLGYSAETYYPTGGIATLAKQICTYINESGSKLKFKNKVNEINFDNKFYNLKTTSKEEYQAKGIISNIPIWNLLEISPTRNNQAVLNNYLQKHINRFEKIWGAFTVYLAVKASPSLKSNYYQIHLDKPIEHLHSGSIFATISDDEDQIKAPLGWKTITISSHTETSFWFDLEKEKYTEIKEKVQSEILENLYRVFPELRNAEKQFLMSGTPKSFKTFTSRFQGRVGGIPYSTKVPMLLLPPNQIPMPNFYLVGDTTFPGQGIASVVYSGISVANKISNKS